MARAKAPVSSGTGPREAPGATPAVTKAAPTGTPKSTVVLRAGPSKRKGLLVDLTTGVLGVVLLVAAFLLLDVLPVEDVPPNEFKVTFEPVTSNLTMQTHRLTMAEQNFDFTFEIAEDDVYRVDFSVSFTDDIPGSAPDQFSYELRRFDGEPTGQPISLANGPGRLVNGSNTQFEAFPASASHAVTMVPKPQDAIVRAQPGATREEVEGALLEKEHLLTKGTWKVHVTLVGAGGCQRPTPAPTTPAVPSPDETARYTDCVQDAQAMGNAPEDSEEDLGNDFTVGVFSYTRFVVHAVPFG